MMTTYGVGVDPRLGVVGVLGERQQRIQRAGRGATDETQRPEERGAIMRE
jgi:hypothetical protein